MSGSIWSPGGTAISSTANADNTYLSQRFVATLGQTIFNLTAFNYQIGTGSIEVFINGVVQSQVIDFTETSNSSVTLIGSLDAGDIVVIRGFVGGTASQAAAGSATAAANSAAAAAASATAANNSYLAILAISPAQLPLPINQGGTGVAATTKAAAFAAIAPPPGVNSVISSIDGINWTSNFLTTLGIGGAVSTTSVVLTPTSPGAQAMTPVGYGQSFTLPDATQMILGSGIFNLSTTNDIPVKILNSVGGLLGFVPAFSTVVVSLSSKVTAAGIWTLVGAAPVAVSARIENIGLTAVSGTIQARVPVDATRTLFLVGSGTNNLYAQVYDSGALTFGTPTLVRSGAGNAKAILSAANQVLVASCDNTTLMQFVTLSLSGTTITVNTAIPITLADTLSSLKQLIAVGTYFVLAYSRSVCAISAISIAGTVPTISAESVLTGTSPTGTQLLFAATGTVFLALSQTTASNTYVRPFTLSAGPSLAAGTETNVASASTDCRMFVLGARWGLVYGTGANLNCAVINLAGTVASNTIISGGAFSQPSILGNTDYYISGSKILVGFANAVNNIYFQIFTDTAGTVSAGTLLTVPTANTITVNNFSFSFASGSIITYHGVVTNTSITSWNINIAGSSPLLSAVHSINANVSGGIVTPSPQGNEFKSFNVLQGAGVNYTLNSTAVQEATYITSAGPGLMSRFRGAPLNYGTSWPGVANELWQVSSPVTGTSFSLVRFECATV
jgi:hypothetical protein